MQPGKGGPGVFAVKRFCVDPFHIDLDAVGHATVGQRLLDGFIGILKLHIFADDGDIHLAIGVMNAVGNVLPDAKVRLGRGGDVESVQHRLIQPLFMIGQRRLVDRVQVIGGDHGIGAHIAKQADLGAFLVGNRMFRTTNQHVGRDPDTAQFLDAVLGGFCFQFTRGGQIGQQRQMHENALATRFVLGKLADRLEKGQGLDIADGAADFTEHEINLVLADADEFLDLVGDMRDHLNGLAQIVPTPFFFQHGGIDAPRRNGIRVARSNAGKTLVVTKVQIGFRTIVRHEYFAMFKG